MTETSPNNLEELAPLSIAVLEGLIAAKKMVATAESCTGGLICGALTEIAGSSAAVDRGFVTYSNEAKNEMLGVPKDLIEKFGAVSKEVAIAMAEGALARSNADVAVSVTGIAGPGGGSPQNRLALSILPSRQRIARRIISIAGLQIAAGNQSGLPPSELPSHRF